MAQQLRVGTIVAKNYLPFARVLAKSLRTYHPDVHLVVLLTDEADGCFDPTAEPFEILPFSTMQIPASDELRFRYQMHQLAAALKPHLLRHLLDQGAESAVFFDPDILVTGDLSAYFETVSEHSITLLPHLLSPNATAWERTILLSGVVNGGSLGVTRSPATTSFLSWWQDRLETHCRDDIARGMHNDQRWLDMALAMFDGAYLHRDGGLNVAYWNLAERRVRMAGDGFVANDRPGRFFHFSGYEPDRPDQLTRYYPERRLTSAAHAAPIFNHYRSLVMDEGWQESQTWPYSYATFDNGVRIPSIARTMYANMADDVTAFGNPFATRSATAFYQWLLAPASSSQDQRINRLVYGLWQTRVDVQQVFPDPFGEHAGSLLDWARKSGAVEHNVDARLLG